MDIAEMKAKAEAGSTVARSMLGLSYLYGDDVPKDYAEALHWLTLASNDGASRPMLHLGLMYKQGLGVSVDMEKAFNLCKRSADRGEADAYIQVAKMYREGMGTERDEQAALDWYEEAVTAAEKGWHSDLLEEARNYIQSHRSSTN